MPVKVDRAAGSIIQQHESALARRVPRPPILIVTRAAPLRFQSRLRGNQRHIDLGIRFRFFHCGVSLLCLARRPVLRSAKARVMVGVCIVIFVNLRVIKYLFG